MLAPNCESNIKIHRFWLHPFFHQKTHNDVTKKKWARSHVACHGDVCKTHEHVSAKNGGYTKTATLTVRMVKREILAFLNKHCWGVEVTALKCFNCVLAIPQYRIYPKIISNLL